jgi:hypothetical protein
MKNKINFTLIILAFIFSVSSVIITVIPLIGQGGGYEANDSYTLYIGTSDKDTGKLEIPIEEAKAIITDIAYKYVEGFTCYTAEGGWIDGDMQYDETSLVYVFVGIDKESAEAIADEVCVALNQASVLIEYSKTYSTFYSAN